MPGAEIGGGNDLIMRPGRGARISDALQTLFLLPVRVQFVDVLCYFVVEICALFTVPAV